MDQNQQIKDKMHRLQVQWNQECERFDIQEQQQEKKKNWTFESNITHPIKGQGDQEGNKLDECYAIVEWHLK